MQPTLTVLMAQIDLTVGAIEANADKISRLIQQHQANHDLIIFPELALTGYPPEDLLLREELYQRVDQALKHIQSQVSDCHVIIGHPCQEKGGLRFNAASVFFQNHRVAIYHKQKLPNYGVFDEARYFTAGESNACVLTIKNYRLALCICEDIWHKEPVERMRHAGVDGIVCINSSPFDYPKPALRETLLAEHAKQGLFLIYVNQVGGQDEIVFDGQSLVFDNQGQLQARGLPFEEQLHTVVITKDQIKGQITPLLEPCELIYQALVCGTRDYIEKNGFSGVLVGLSGGIDSALTLAIAVDALGADRVQALMMPSRYTASMSNEDALAELALLGVKGHTLSIEPGFETMLNTLDPLFQGLPKDHTEENIQARLRGLLLMAFSNKTGMMVLTTSNKSETAVGYATLYGDMAGGFGVLKDVLKTQVYDLARYRNRIAPVIPERVILRPPSAELAENQTDQDSLPPYEILDAIIVDYVEHNLSQADIVNKGFAKEVVQQVVKRIHHNEYKRKQAAPGIKISRRAFGRDWRYPITSKF